LTGKYGTSERPESGRLVDDPRYVDRYDLDTDFATADQFTEFAKKLDARPRHSQWRGPCHARM
jgi:hypothetical protein